MEHLNKSFGSVPVLNDVSFVAEDKQFVTLLGPSGCGKTTTLMSIAGLERPDRGRILCGDEVLLDTDINRCVPAERRSLGVVFQSYAIWPHMTVLENVMFPLRVRKSPKEGARARALEMLDLVEMADHHARYPHELSGGQQQRVALARALVYAPGVLLLDEPFSNLDAKLRERARSWLKHLQHTIGVTTIFVTHDQEEALTMSDRVLVMHNGQILRDGPPMDVYLRPKHRFVGEFLGQCSFITGTVESRDGTLWLGNDLLRHGIPLADLDLVPGVTATVAVRPENVEVMDEIPSAPGWTQGAIVEDTYLGDHFQYVIEVGSGRMTVSSRQQLHSKVVHLRLREGGASVVS